MAAATIYESRVPWNFALKVDLRDRQITDLRRVAARLHEAFPDLTIETYFARLEGKDPERVVFERV